MTHGVFNGSPSWSPNGERIAFAGLTNGSLNIYSISATDNSAPATLMVGRPGWDADPAWSPIGNRIAYTSDWAAYDFVYDLYVSNLDGSSITPISSSFPSGVFFFAPAWSPNGGRLAAVGCKPAFSLCDSSELWTMNDDGTDKRILASAGRKASAPAWAPDGQTIAYSAGGRVAWISADGSAHGVIVENGHSPAWRW
jgi:TolB protein